MTDLKPDHPAVRAANMGVQEWLAGDGPFDDDPPLEGRVDRQRMVRHDGHLHERRHDGEVRQVEDLSQLVGELPLERRPPVLARRADHRDDVERERGGEGRVVGQVGQAEVSGEDSVVVNVRTSTVIAAPVRSDRRADMASAVASSSAGSS